MKGHDMIHDLIDQIQRLIIFGLGIALIIGAIHMVRP